MTLRRITRNLREDGSNATNELPPYIIPNLYSTRSPPSSVRTFNNPRISPSADFRSGLSAIRPSITRQYPENTLAQSDAEEYISPIPRSAGPR